MVIDLAVRHGINTIQQVGFAIGAIGGVVALIVIFAMFRRSRRKK